MTDRPQTNATNAPAEWEAYAWKLERERDEAVAALRELNDWTNRMPDAGFTSLDPRWSWWTEGVAIRERALRVVASSSTPEPDA